MGGYVFSHDDNSGWDMMEISQEQETDGQFTCAWLKVQGYCDCENFDDLGFPEGWETAGDSKDFLEISRKDRCLWVWQNCGGTCEICDADVVTDSEYKDASHGTIGYPESWRSRA